MSENKLESVRIGYLTSLYPRASDTFVRLEVDFLREAGLDVQTFSVRQPERSLLVSKQVETEAQRTTFLLGGNPCFLFAAALLAALTNPLGFLKAAALMWRTGVPGLRGRFKHAAYLIEAAYLARLLQRRGIRHLHNHIGENSATVAMLASQISGIPFSMTIHGPGIFFHPRQWALSEKIQRAAFTACISHFCKSQCMAVSPASAWNRLRLVRCCVDSTFVREPMTPVPQNLTFTFVGRLCAEKGIQLLVEAINRFRLEGLPIRLRVIGDGPLRPEIESMIRDNDLGHYIELLGWQSSEAVRQYLVETRALILPSFAEGLPVVLMEALAMQRPVITTRIAGIPELVEDGISGWIIEPGSVDALVEAMQQACTAPAEVLTEMGRAGARRVAEHHNARIEVPKLISHILDSIDSEPMAPVVVASGASSRLSRKLNFPTAVDPCS